MLVVSRCLFRRCPFRRCPFHRCLASSSSAKASPANIFFPMALPGSSISAIAPPLATARPLATAPRPATSQHSAPASNIFPMALRHGAPASNKPHSAERSTPVWLAIWRIWAGFANSQLRRAAFRCTYSYICTHPRHCRLEAAAQTDANLSAHLHRLPTPPTYLRRMRL